MTDRLTTAELQRRYESCKLLGASESETQWAYERWMTAFKRDIAREYALQTQAEKRKAAKALSGA